MYASGYDMQKTQHCGSQKYIFSFLSFFLSFFSPIISTRFFELAQEELMCMCLLIFFWMYAFTMPFNNNNIFGAYWMDVCVGAYLCYLLLLVRIVPHYHTEPSTLAATDCFFWLVKWGIIVMRVNHWAKSGSSRVFILLPSSRWMKPTSWKCGGL